MPPADANFPEQGHSDQTGGAELPLLEPGLLNRVREVARRITERVQKTLSDTDIHLPPDGTAPEA